MKKIILISTALIFLIKTGFAQTDSWRANERIASLRIAFLTEKLSLTPEESQSFWPLYNELRQKIDTLEADRIRPMKVFDMTDEEAERFITKSFEIEQQVLNLKQEYFDKFKEVLPIRKIARIRPAEREFKRKLLERVRKRQFHGKRF